VTGSFIIRGKKNFVNPPKLELGYTVMFVLDDISMLNHENERRLRGANDDGEMELLRNTSETLDEEFDDDEEDEVKVVSSKKVEEVKNKKVDVLKVVEEKVKEENKNVEEI
jgi:hypothetical protein